jgi:hypothetical protein
LGTGPLASTKLRAKKSYYWARGDLSLLLSTELGILVRRIGNMNTERHIGCRRMREDTKRGEEAKREVSEYTINQQGLLKYPSVLKSVLGVLADKGFTTLVLAFQHPFSNLGCLRKLYIFHLKSPRSTNDFRSWQTWVPCVLCSSLALCSISCVISGKLLELSLPVVPHQ